MKGRGSCDSEMCQAFLGFFLGGVVHTPPLTSGSASSQISSAHPRHLLETTQHRSFRGCVKLWLLKLSPMFCQYALVLAQVSFFWDERIFWVPPTCFATVLLQFITTKLPIQNNSLADFCDISETNGQTVGDNIWRLSGETKHAPKTRSHNTDLATLQKAVMVVIFDRHI